MPAREIANLFLTGKWQRAVGNHFYIKSLFIPVTKIIPLSARNRWPGVLDGKHYENFMRERLPSDFDQLPIRFRAVSVDLCTGKSVVLSSGNLSRAILASSAATPAIRPVEMGDALLADGGLRSNLPTECARKAGEGDVFIVVSSDGPISPRKKRYFNSLQRINRRSIDLLSYQSDEVARNNATILIAPDIDDLPVMTKNKKKIQSAIDAGRQAALRELPNIHKILNE
jgi:NTE family protein